MTRSMEMGATFSLCRKYRYDLWRIWAKRKPMCSFIGLNPSTATETEDDPTVRRCINFAKKWGYGGMFMLNLFGYRATNPDDMKRQDDPVGPDNDKVILQRMSESGLIVVAWGVHGKHNGRDASFLNWVKPIELHCLGTTKRGFPKHPLYLEKKLDPIPFRY